LVSGGAVFAISSVNDNLFFEEPEEAVTDNAVKYIPKGDVIFENSNAKARDINPTKLTLTGIDPGYKTINWTVTSQGAGTQYKGTGTVISSEIRMLSEKRLSGTYDVNFEIMYSHGSLDVDTKFQIK
jgi:hypothetical protein